MLTWIRHRLADFASLACTDSESAENMLPSKVLGEVVSDEDQGGAVLGMLEEVYGMIHELDRQRLQHERFLRIQRNVRTNQVDVADVWRLDAKRLRQE